MRPAFSLTIHPDAMLASLHPTDAIEQMHANCVMLSYQAGMEEYLQADQPGQSPEVASALRKGGLALLRFAAVSLRRLEERQGWEPPRARRKREAAERRAADPVGMPEGMPEGLPVGMPMVAPAAVPEPVAGSALAEAKAVPPVAADDLVPEADELEADDLVADADELEAAPLLPFDLPAHLADLPGPALLELTQRMAALMSMDGKPPPGMGPLFSPELMAALSARLGGDDHETPPA